QSQIQIPGERITHLALTPNGEYLVAAVANADSNGVPSGGVYVVVLTQTPPLVVSAYMGSDIQSVVVAKNSSFALIADRGKYAANNGIPTESQPGSLVRVRLSGNRPSVTDALKIGFEAGGVAIAPNDADAYVLNDGLNRSGEQLSTIQLAPSSLRVVSSVKVTGNGIALSPNGDTAYVGGEVVDVLPPTPSVQPAPALPNGLTSLKNFTVQAITPDGRLVYLSGGQKSGAGGLEQVLEDTSTSPPTMVSSNLTDCSTVTADPQGGTVYCGSTLSYPEAPSISSLSSPDGGISGGFELTLHGTYFGGTTSVVFGTIDANVNSINRAGTALVVTVPQGSIGSVPITVTTAGGNTAPVPASIFRYANLPAVSLLTPTSGLIQGGTRVLLSGSGFSVNDVVDFGANNPGQVIKVSADGDYMAVSAPGGSHSVYVTVSTPGGTSLIAPMARFRFIKRRPMVNAMDPASGAPAGGYGLLIGGKYLNGATTVTFGSTTVKPISVSSDGDFLGVVVPRGVGTVEVIVTTPSGTSRDTSKDQFTYTGS
ncbi:MAG TPA: IPT/TIG domain-containing protein, partial [Acidimicrobiales bacterium]